MKKILKKLAFCSLALCSTMSVPSSIKTDTTQIRSKLVDVKSDIKRAISTSTLRERLTLTSQNTIPLKIDGSTHQLVSDSSISAPYVSVLKKVPISTKYTSYEFQAGNIYFVDTASFGNQGQLSFSLPKASDKTAGTSPTYYATYTYDQLKEHKYVLVSPSTIVYGLYKGYASQSLTHSLTISQTDELTEEDVINKLNLKSIFGFDIASTSVESSNYVKGKVGQSQIVLNCYDKLNNDKHILTVNVTCNRNVIEDNTYTLYLSKVDNIALEQIQTLFGAEDIFHQEVDIELTDDGGYLPGVADTYTLIYTATDKYDNTATLTVTVVVNDYAPVFSLNGTSSNEFLVKYSQNVTEEFILDFILVKEYDGTLIDKSNIKWDKPFDATAIGKTTYTLSCSSLISPTSTSTFEIVVDVDQDIPPIFFVTSNIAITSANTPLNYDQLKALISRVENVDLKYMSSFEISNFDDYYTNYAEAVDLNYSYRYMNEARFGTLSVKPISQDLNADNPSTLVSLWQAYLNKCVHWYDYISYFFTYLIPTFFRIIFGGGN